MSGEDSTPGCGPHSKSIGLGTPCETSHLSKLWAKQIFQKKERKINTAVQKWVKGPPLRLLLSPEGRSPQRPQARDERHLWAVSGRLFLQ